MLFAAKNFFGGGSSGVGTAPDKSSRPADSERKGQDDYWPEEFDEHGNAVEPSATPKAAAQTPKGESLKKGFTRRLFTPGRSSKSEPGQKQNLRDIFKKGPRQALQDKALDKASDYTKDKAGKLWEKSGGKAKADKLFKHLDEKTGGAASKLKGQFGKEGIPLNREELKKQAKDYIKKEGKDEIKKAIQNRLEGGLKKGVKKGAKEGAEKLAKTATKDVVKAGTKAAVRGGVKAGATVGTEAVVEAAGAAGIVGGPAVIISEILAQLIVIAISLGISDAIDSAIAFATGHPAKGLFLAIRAATKIIVFVLWLLLAIICSAIIPIPMVGLGISLIPITLYWIAGSIPFLKELPFMQGLVWWKKIIIAVMDIYFIFAAIMVMVVSIYVWCNIGFLGGSVVGGPIGGAIGGMIDNATTEKGSYCSAFQNLTGGGDFGGGGAGGSVDGDGDVTAPGYTPTPDACGGDPSKLCKANFPNDRCKPEVVNRCNSPEYTAVFQSGLNMYRQNGGTDIPGINMLVLVKSVAAVERGCTKVGACSPAGACGIVQFMPATARQYAPKCGAQVGSWPSWANENPEILACMAAFYFKDLAGTSMCGSPTVQVRNIAAGYNAGQGNCGRSTNSGCQVSSCDGSSPLRKWECKCGRNPDAYNETAFYGPAVAGCYYNAFK